MIYWLFGAMVVIGTGLLVYRVWRIKANPEIHWIKGTKRKP